MRGVTIIIKFIVSRPIPTFLNRRLTYGMLLRNGRPCSLRDSVIRLTPPSRIVPPSGTLTTVLTEVVAIIGNWTVTPVEVVSISSSLASGLLISNKSSRNELVEVAVEVDPSKGEGFDVADLSELWYQCHSYRATIVGNDSRNI